MSTTAPVDGRTLHGEWIRLVAEQAQRMTLQRYLTCALVAALVGVHAGPAPALAWWLLAATAVTVRTSGVARLARRRRLSDRERLWRVARLYWISGAVQGSVLLFFPSLPVLLWGVITVYLVGSCSAALHALAGYRPIFLPYCLLTLGASTVAWLLAPGQDVGGFERLAFAALGLAFTTTLLSQAKGTYLVFRESFAMRQERLELSAQLQAALADAEAANAAKTRFLAAASHDLRQPVHALSMFTAALRRRPMESRTATIAEQLDRAVRSLTIELDALLDISRLEADAVTRARAPVELQGLLSRMAAESAAFVAQKGLVCRTRCAEGLWVRTHPELLQRILRNLLTNAVKYTVHGSVELYAESSDGKVRIGVLDTGPGIPPQEQARIFEEFYRVQGEVPAEVESYGLGLAIVRRLATLAGLELHLESRLGWGSRFWLELEAITPPPAAAPSSGAEDADLAPERPGEIRVLVVDDEPQPRLATQALLEALGFQVRVAACMRSAMALAGTLSPQLLLTDLRLDRHMEGLDLLAQVRRQLPGLAAVVLSGDTSPEALAATKAAGVELLHKPVTPQCLQEAIGRALAPRPALPK
ncbi:MAG TPA: ATP-binding protein [Solimonas sp.]|nr:ATP-binding protein [Solimonas sp.]